MNNSLFYLLISLIGLLFRCVYTAKKSGDSSTTVGISKKTTSNTKAKEISNKGDFTHHKLTKSEYSRKFMKIENEKLKRFDENKDGYLNFGELQKMAIAEEEMEKVINETGKRKNGKDKNKDPTKKIMRDWPKMNVKSGLKKVFFGSLDLDKDGFVTMKEGMQIVGKYVKKKFDENKDKLIDMLKVYLIKHGFMMLLG